MLFRKIIPFFIILTLSSQLFARSYVGHLGLGVSTQLVNDIPSISIKNYSSDSFAWGLMGNFSTADDNGGWGIGGKVYKNFFAEPHLFFFVAGMFGVVNSKSYSNDSDSQTGIQADLTAGSEFFIPGLESLGFSFETGLSLNTINEFVVETSGSTFVTAEIHFYL
ncbi:MAG: hypothetical protein DRQ88_03660 [Epsilonproteobacteria bacterium]|nr:MAG: hypothetical protein DRQ88_03660 [Campylobacterota bacterium]